MRDYQLLSPSLDGILHHESVVYEGISRPAELLRLMDRPRAAKDRSYTEHEQKIISQYFHDLYAIFMKKLAYFIAEPDPRPDDTVKLQALLQEMIKIKKITSKTVDL